MPHKRHAVVAAMPIELAPLLGKLAPRQVNGVDLFELPNALVAVGGIGEKFARRAAEVAVREAQPKRLLSAGVVGAIAPALKVGEVGRISEVVDVATGNRYPCSEAGTWVLATSQEVSDAAEKQELSSRYGAHVVDMEAAAVAEVAKANGLEFVGIKAISDDASFDMPPLGRFIDQNGRFATRRFLMFVALHPKWWAALGRIRKNSALATKNLCRELEHLLEGDW